MTAPAIEIPLTQGFVAIIDAADEQLVAPFKWYAARRRRTVYAQRACRVGDLRTTQRMHSLLTGWPYVDHINGNGWDNRRANLRPATNRENSQNRRRIVGAYKGVYRQPDCDRWRAQIAHRGRHQHLGLFASAEGAAMAYDAAARDLFGEYAALNFPRPGERAARSA